MAEAPLRHGVRFQILACAFEISTNSDRLWRKLKYLVQKAEQDFPVERTVRIDVRYDGEEYVILEDGREYCREYSAEQTLSVLYGQTQHIVFEQMSDWVELHCACLDWKGRRVILTGPSGAGKTSISLRMMFLGADLLTDERVLVCRDRVMPYPRRIHIKHSGLRYHPELAPLVPDLPAYGDDGYRVYSLSPHDLGRSWVLKPGPIDAIAYLEPNHGGQTRMRSVPSLEMAQRLMSQAYPPHSGRPGWIADIAAAVGRADCGVLFNGDVQRSADAILRWISSDLGSAAR